MHISLGACNDYERVDTLTACAKIRKINGTGRTRVGELLTVYAADRPVTFLQPPEGAFVPATKLTAEHCSNQHQQGAS